MVGLDAAGKTTILYKLKLGEGEFLVGFLYIMRDSCCLLTDFNGRLSFGMIAHPSTYSFWPYET